MQLQSELDIVVVAEAADGLTAAFLAERACPSVAVIDAVARGERGLSDARALRAAFPPLPIVFVCLADDPALRVGPCAAGADSFICKASPRESLVEVVRSLGPCAQGRSSAADATTASPPLPPEIGGTADDP